MARIFEHQGKSLLGAFSINVPEGSTAGTAEEAAIIFEKLQKPVVIKAQTWTTGRAQSGGIKFAGSAEEARAAASAILGSTIKGFTVTEVRVEEKLDIAREFYAGVIIDDNGKQPLLLFSSVGGTGIEEIAALHPDKVVKYPIDIIEGLEEFKARDLVRETGISGKLQVDLASLLVKLYRLCRSYEMRSAEINPLVLASDGRLYAADCHMALDDYAVFRHPDCGIEIARDLSNPPSALDKIAFNVEKGDYRGTFYFIQLERDFSREENYVGFHGAGGGGSMMSMDAVLAAGFKIANFCDTSGNPPASKVYRAAKIILSQRHIVGYFGSGSGVASQEQFHSARGLLKAFMEDNLQVPAVIRLGGNQEEKAMELFSRFGPRLAVPVECYGKDTSAVTCAGRLKALTAEREKPESPVKPERAAETVKSYSFKTVTGGEVSFDYTRCGACESKACSEECIPKILKLEEGRPVLAITAEEAAKGKCIECLACELECLDRGKGGARIDLPIPGLEEYRGEGR
ncbi:MAG: ATP-grasp domain-containing protein [Candidatus Eremiobacteraeota bacterium]|nr:ATP-grasp domain-containing protein [Candidatus Eremiobacteraeota bacterium]